MSWFRSMPRRFAFSAIAAVLAAGAPIGLALVRSATSEPGLAALVRSVGQDLPTFVYVTVSTLVVFSAFGYVIGRQGDALADLSRTDPLTGLINSRYRAPLSLLIADVDGLKGINDRGGHSAGNLALRRVAAALSDDARRTDLVARIGGDEFALIAPHTDARDASALAERIRSLVAEQGGVEGTTISIGVATLDPERPAASTLFDAADSALYEAKRRGRNRVAAAAGAPRP
jgi:diguanylate cyclase (GGDEF)-like protein